MAGGMKYPPHSQLLLPMLEIIAANGGSARPQQTAAALAERVGLSEAETEVRAPLADGREFNVWERHVRWVRQTAVQRGLLDATRRGLWTLTERADDSLERCRPGVCIVIYETPNGQMLWAEAETAIGVLEEQSVQLLFTSPPYPLMKPRRYGNRNGDDYLEWLCRFFTDARRVLDPGGSLVINLMDMQSAPGMPTLSLYKEKLLLHLVEQAGYHLIQNFYWHSPCKMATGHWVTVRRERITPSVENLFWLSPTPRPRTYQKQVLQPYGPEMRRYLAKGGCRRAVRPSGQGSALVSHAVDHGGSIPKNLLTFTNSAGNTRYHRFCRERGLPIHPATMPEGVAEFCIKFLTAPRDLVFDPFGGSNVTGATAERLDRAWVTSEKALAYIRGSAGRLG